MTDLVNHPAHYQRAGLEAIDVIDAFFPASFNRANTFKYLARAGHKDSELQDLKKAQWYLDREVRRVAALELGGTKTKENMQ